jgi:lysozyme
VASIELTSAASYFRGLSHQIAAWNWLQEQLPPEQLAEFAEMYRAGPPANQQPQPAGNWLMICTPLVQQFEGCRLTAYPDPGTGGDPWTIGWGSTTYANGGSVKPGDRIDQAQADQLLISRLQRDWRTLAGQIPGWDQMRPGQQAALVSFAYNVGVGFYQSSGFNTISHVLSSQDWASVPNALMLYVNPGTSVEAGLRRRRTAEGTTWVKA